MNSFGDFTRDWLNLPWDPLFRIIESSFSLSDYIRFGAVCVQWRFFYVQNYDRINELFSRRPPLFLYSPKEDRPLERKREITTGRFFSLLDNKVYKFRFPSPCFKNFHGSTHGWLVTVDEEKPYSVRLLNPFFNRNKNRSSSSAANADAEPAFNEVINLPPLFQIHDCSSYNFSYPNKVVLSASPSLSNPNNFVAMALVRGNGWEFYPTDLLAFYPSGLGFCRPGDSAWTSLPFEGQPFNDIVYHKGKFYVVEDRGALISIDFGGCFPHFDNEPKIVRVIDQPPRIVVDKMWLVESSGDLLLVYKFYYMGRLRFEVFKLVGFTHWVEMKTLEDRILFLSNSGSMSVSASDCPGFKPNYIYHSLFYSRRSSHIAVFNFENGNSEQNTNFEGGSIQLDYDMKPMVPQAIWIQPAL